MAAKKKAAKKKTKKKAAKKKTVAKKRALTTHEEMAAQAFIEHKGNKTEAYRSAYSTEGMADSTQWRKAHELFKQPHVMERVLELMAEHRDRHNVTIDSITDEYDENRRIALQLEQPAAMNAATTGKAKLHGLLVDKIANPDGTPLDLNWTVKVMTGKDIA